MISRRPVLHGAVVFFLFFSVFFCCSVEADCINYGDYLNWEGSVDTPGIAIDVASVGSYAYVADHFRGLQVVDLSDPQNPSIVLLCQS